MTRTRWWLWPVNVIAIPYVWIRFPREVLAYTRRVFGL